MSWPIELRFNKTQRLLTILFDDNTSGTISYQRLRAESPSAENKGHGDRVQISPNDIPSDITVLEAEPVGRYAVRIVFSDGHKTGLYTWKLLERLIHTPV